MIRTTHVLGAAVSAALLLTAAPATAHDGAQDGDRGRDEVINQGSCDGTARWKVKAKTDDGGLEVEGEVDSNRTGQTWAWSIRRDGEVLARGSAQTRGRSGSFSVERNVSDGAGRDRITFLAKQRGTGQTCQGAVTI